MTRAPDTLALRLLRWFALAVALPALAGFVAYYGFCTNYTGRVFHEAGFRELYGSGVYRYRIVGPRLLLETYHLLRRADLSSPAIQSLRELPASIYRMDPRADPLLYAAHAIHNTFFAVVCAVFLYPLLVTNSASAAGVRALPQVTGILLVAMGQYVVTPYDTLSYACVALALLLIVRQRRAELPLLAAMVVLATLVRESAALAISFYAAYHWRELRHHSRRHVAELAGLAFAFAATYVGLRLWLGTTGNAVFQTIHWAGSFHPTSLAGVGLLVVVGYGISAGSHNKTACWFFVLASSPYVAVLLVIARPWEIRLWTPIWLGLLVLAHAVDHPPRSPAQTEPAVGASLRSG